MKNIDYKNRMREELVLELEEMKKFGIYVSDETLQQAKVASLTEYDAIKIGELASLFCELYN